MTKSDEEDLTPERDPRRAQLLEAALSVFVRYGFRKTSMEEVSRAAHLSRQGLYLHFETKEELFRATVRHFLATSLQTTHEILADTEHTIEDRLVRALDAWFGRYVGLVSGDAKDLAEVSAALLGTQVKSHEQALDELLTKALRGAGFAAAYKPAAINVRQLSETLRAVAVGLKHTCATRAEFMERITIAVRALSLPLRVSP
jgi:TetR/AcrR family transcriptional regulator, regulator of autoinduction and epiphytic fitness